MGGKMEEEFMRKYATQANKLAAQTLSDGKPYSSWNSTAINSYVLDTTNTKSLSDFGIEHSKTVFYGNLLKLSYEGSPNFFTYMWAKENLIGTKILEVGLSHYAGFGGASILRDVPGIDYLGIDINLEYVEKNSKFFGSKYIRFETWDIKKFPWNDFYDTIIAFEFIEHMANPLELADKMKKHCTRLLTTKGGYGHLVAPDLGLDKLTFFVLSNSNTESGIYMGVDGVLDYSERAHIIKMLDIQDLIQVSDNIYHLRGTIQ